MRLLLGLCVALACSSATSERDAGPPTDPRLLDAFPLPPDRPPPPPPPDLGPPDGRDPCIAFCECLLQDEKPKRFGDCVNSCRSDILSLRNPADRCRQFGADNPGGCERYCAGFPAGPDGSVPDADYAACEPLCACIVPGDAGADDMGATCRSDCRDFVAPSEDPERRCRSDPRAAACADQCEVFSP
jgi:hypothetical protein